MYETFSVHPVAGLAVGTHTTRVEITLMGSYVESFYVTFVVEDVAPTPSADGLIVEDIHLPYSSWFGGARVYADLAFVNFNGISGNFIATNITSSATVGLDTWNEDYTAAIDVNGLGVLPIHVERSHDFGVFWAYISGHFEGCTQTIVSQRFYITIGHVNEYIEVRIVDAVSGNPIPGSTLFVDNRGVPGINEEWNMDHPRNDGTGVFQITFDEIFGQWFATDDGRTYFNAEAHLYSGNGFTLVQSAKASIADGTDSNIIYIELQREFSFDPRDFLLVEVVNQTTGQLVADADLSDFNQYYYEDKPGWFLIPMSYVWDVLNAPGHGIGFFATSQALNGAQGSRMVYYYELRAMVNAGNVLRAVTVYLEPVQNLTPSLTITSTHPTLNRLSSLGLTAYVENAQGLTIQWVIDNHNELAGLAINGTTNAQLTAEFHATLGPITVRANLLDNGTVVATSNAIDITILTSNGQPSFVAPATTLFFETFGGASHIEMGNIAVMNLRIGVRMSAVNNAVVRIETPHFVNLYDAIALLDTFEGPRLVERTSYAVYIALTQNFALGFGAVDYVPIFISGEFITASLPGVSLYFMDGSRVSIVAMN